MESETLDVTTEELVIPSVAVVDIGDVDVACVTGMLVTSGWVTVSDVDEIGREELVIA